MTKGRAAFALTVGALLAGATVPGAAERPPPWEKPLERRGQALYREHCVVCHEIEQADSKGKLGPSMHRLFQNEQLPSSGGVPNEPYVRVKIQYGGDVMPAYVNRLSEREIDTLIEFIRLER